MSMQSVTCLHVERVSATVVAMSTIGARIRAARLAKGLTQAQVSTATGFGVTRISDIERDRYEVPDGRTFLKLSEALGVSLDELFSGPRPAPRELGEWKLLAELDQAVAAIEEPDARRLAEDRLNAFVRRAAATLELLHEVVDRLPLNLTVTPDALSDLLRQARTGQSDSHQPGESVVPASARILEDQRRERDDQLAEKIKEAASALFQIATALQPEAVGAASDRAASKRRHRKAG